MVASPFAAEPYTSAQTLAARAASLRRLSTLLGVAEGAWALGLYHSDDVRDQVQTELEQALAPLPVHAVPLVHEERNLLTILHSGSANHRAPVKTFYPLPQEHALLVLCRHLDLQRESLARQPHRLLFWVNPDERRFLAEHAPNFYSRLSGVFDFPGRAENEVPLPSADFSCAGSHSMKGQL